jgi:dTMP kinase
MVAPEVVCSVSGALITLEGVEGSGKTTQMMRLERWLRKQGRRVEHTREPDGTRLGVEVRRLFERPGVQPTPLVEVFLFMAARQQHVTEKIRPWLDRGRVVLCDRYADATVAYQGYGRGVDADLIRELNVRATSGVMPDLTLLFDLDPAAGLRRNRAKGRRLDRFEREALAFHRKVRRGYLEILRAEPKRVRLIRASQPPAVVEAEVRAIVEDFFRGA